MVNLSTFGRTYGWDQYLGSNLLIDFILFPYYKKGWWLTWAIGREILGNGTFHGE